MQASKIILENSKELLKNYDFYISIPIEDSLAADIKLQLVRNGKLDDDVLDWVCGNLKYIPERFLRHHAKYDVIKEKDGFYLRFAMLLFSELTFMALMLKIDEISGGFQITSREEEEEDFFVDLNE